MNEVKHGFRLTGWHVAAMMVAFFSVIVAVNLTMATLASSSWTGLVVKNSYVASQQFNTRLAVAREQAARGWTVHLAATARQLTIEARDRNGDPVAFSQAAVSVGRPAHEGLDRTVRLVHQGGGLHRADIALAPGPWAARLDALSGNDTYHHVFRFIVRENEP